MSLVDDQTRHQVYIQRYSAGLWREVKPIIRRLRDDLSRRIAGSDFQASRIAALYIELDSLMALAGDSLSEQLSLELTKFGEYEAEFQAKMLDRYITVEVAVPPPEQVAAAATRTRMAMVTGEVYSIKDLVGQFTRAKRQEVRTLISTGFIEGRTTQEISKDIGRLINTRTARQAETLVRTATNHMATIARREVIEGNRDALDGERYIATLDGRTTVTCASFDQKLFAVGDGPMPPLHWNCRSTRVPSIKPELRVPGVFGERASIDGPVSDRLTYDGWLRRQSQEFQNDTLGPERAEMFRSGMKIDRFTDERGRELTLAELRARS